MKLNRRQLKKLVMEQMSKINEHGNPVALDASMSLPEMVEAALSVLPEPYTISMEGNKIVCYGYADKEGHEVVFEVNFK